MKTRRDSQVVYYVKFDIVINWADYDFKLVAEVFRPVSPSAPQILSQPDSLTAHQWRLITSSGTAGCHNIFVIFFFLPIYMYKQPT